MKLLSYSELLLLTISVVLGTLLLFPRDFGYGVPELISFHMIGGRLTWGIIALALSCIDILGMLSRSSFPRRLFASGITGWFFFVAGMEVVSMSMSTSGVFYAIIALYALLYNYELSQVYHQKLVRKKLISAAVHVASR